MGNLEGMKREEVLSGKANDAEFDVKKAQRRSKFAAAYSEIFKGATQSQHGNCTVTHKPPSLRLRALIFPRCSSTVRWAIAKPKP